MAVREDADRAKLNKWTPFVSMQDQYNLVQREEEREMQGLLADQGIGNTIWSPLAGEIVARPRGDKSRTRTASTPPTDQFGRPITVGSDKAIIYAVEKAIIYAVERIAADRAVSMATIGLAWF